MNKKHSKSEDEKNSAIYKELHYKVDVIVFLGSGNVLFRTKTYRRPQAGDKSDVGKHHHLFGHL